MIQEHVVEERERGREGEGEGEGVISLPSAFKVIGTPRSLFTRGKRGSDSWTDEDSFRLKNLYLITEEWHRVSNSATEFGHRK